MSTAAEDGDGTRAESSEDERSRVADGLTATGQPGMSAYGISTGASSSVRKAAEPAAQHDAYPRLAATPCANAATAASRLCPHMATLHSMAVLARWVVVVASVTLITAGGSGGGARSRSLQTGPKVKAPAAIVVDAGTGAVLYAKRPNMRRPIASTTKIMTAIVAMSQLRPNAIVGVPRRRRGSPSTARD